MQTPQPAVVTFENGRYTDDVRVTCLDLLSRNVGIQNVEPIIRSVSSNIFKAELGRLPGTSKWAEMLVEARTVSHLQLAEQIPKERFDRRECQSIPETQKYRRGTQKSLRPNHVYILSCKHASRPIRACVLS